MVWSWNPGLYVWYVSTLPIKLHPSPSGHEVLGSKTLLDTIMYLTHFWKDSSQIEGVRWTLGSSATGCPQSCGLVLLGTESEPGTVLKATSAWLCPSLLYLGNSGGEVEVGAKGRHKFELFALVLPLCLGGAK